MEYTVAVTQTPDGNYMATCPLIPEAVSQGETIEECIANMQEVLELCIEFRKERGEEIPREMGTRKVKVPA
ncbi:MAG: type II toxin-antitoxin system HicB family antitoxin [Dehalococcoidales bacterium]|nr:type II toxin-antitoxin system HicB family antitoxin [Dehalococcoidales bacterium]